MLYKQITLLNELINAINKVNFDTFDCTGEEPKVTGAICLTTGSPSAEYNTAQLFKICENLKLALHCLAGKLDPIEYKKALDTIEKAVLDQTNSNNIDRVVKDVFDCFEEALLSCENCFRTVLTDK